ncbi:MAG: hypothetical protein DDT29_00528 [Dehalococcoidia bacterium]|nr:hypothetical protein [candidate division NPL-UPA2 bacterium]MBT9142135.1 hypothetical protein [Bacillota bacterium]
MAKAGSLRGDADALRNALEELNEVKALRYVLLERVDRIRLALFSFTLGTNRLAENPDENFTEWEEGRAFGPLAELRWSKLGEGNYHICCLSDGYGVFPSGMSGSEVELSQHCRAEQEHYLWGVFEDDSKAWYDERIPQFLAYPLEVPRGRGRMRVVLRTVEYLRLTVAKDGTNSEDRFVRWQDLALKEA